MPRPWIVIVALAGRGQHSACFSCHGTLSWRCQTTSWAVPGSASYRSFPPMDTQHFFTEVHLPHICPLAQFSEVLLDLLTFSEVSNHLKDLRITCKPGNFTAPLHDWGHPCAHRLPHQTPAGWWAGLALALFFSKRLWFSMLAGILFFTACSACPRAEGSSRGVWASRLHSEPSL